jgi:hypothetical protein
VKRILLYWVVFALIGVLMFPSFQGNAQSNSNQLVFDTLIIYKHYGILMCIDTVNNDTAFYTSDGITGKYADLDSASIDTITGYLKGKADSSGWSDLLDGYNEDYFLDTLFWIDGNVVFVPLAGDIQTYIDAADSGSTLVLASGVYTLTDTLIVDKQLNIRGQGRSGFVTTPVTPSHGTLITSSTADMVAFQVNSDNVRVADLSINLTGAASTAIKVANNLQGVVFNDMDVIVNSTGNVKAVDVKGSDMVIRDFTFYVTSSDASSAGVYFWNDNTTTRDAVVDAFNVTGTVVGAATYAYAFACYNVNDANTLTLNLSSSVCKSLSGTPLDIAVASTSTTTNNSVVNAYMCTFDGADYDGYQTGSNELNLGGSNMANNLISGTVTYRATMVSDVITTNYANIEDSLNTTNARIDTLVQDLNMAGHNLDSVGNVIVKDTMFADFIASDDSNGIRIIEDVDIDSSLALGSTPAYAENRRLKIHDDGVDGNARISLIGTAGNGNSPAIEFVINGSTFRRALVKLIEEGSNDYGLYFYTTDNAVTHIGLSVTGNGDVGIGTETPNAKLDVVGTCIIRDTTVVTAEFNPWILDLSEGYHLGGDSIVVYGDTFPTPQVGWTFIDTSGGDTMKCFLNSAWEAK